LSVLDEVVVLEELELSDFLASLVSDFDEDSPEPLLDSPEPFDSPLPEPPLDRP
jgi:hypothetical protein